MSVTHVAHCDSFGAYFRCRCNGYSLEEFFRYLDARKHRSKVDFGEIDFCSSLRANAKQSSEIEPSPAFVTFVDAHEQLLPLTKREGKNLATSLFSCLAAFTLAEVLVTLGIIGVVSAMTVPTLMQNYQRQSYVTQLHKVYNETTQAALRYVTDRNALNMKEAGMTSTDAAVNFVNTYFKVVNDCGTNASPCFASEYKRMNGTSMGNLFNGGGMRKFSLASGASIGVAGFSNGNMSIYVDVNGQKGPNIVGRDTFPMVLYKNGIVDEGDGTEATDAVTPPISADRREEIYNSWCNVTGDMWWGCMGKIMNDNWQMTY